MAMLIAVNNAEFAFNANDVEAFPSVNDCLCTKMYDDAVAKNDGRYYLKLPEKVDVVSMPDNRQHAKSRLLQQRKLMKNNSELLEFYTNAVQKLIETDKLELVDTDCAPGTSFYIPRFVTSQTKKRPVTCLRRVGKISKYFFEFCPLQWK